MLFYIGITSPPRKFKVGVLSVIATLCFFCQMKLMMIIGSHFIQNSSP